MGGRKRGHVLLKAFEEVRRRIPDARLTIVSRDRAVGPGITSLADVEAAHLGHLYRSHWLLCSASSYEGFGVPYVEAMASGLPIVTTPNHGAEEVLGNGERAIFASPDDLGGSLMASIDDIARREELSRLGVETAKAYSVDVVAGRYEELYSRARHDRSLTVLKE
jgi:glycosyltransferase involved in cell wall biosynthesis